jgi:hypothetical protein
MTHSPRPFLCPLCCGDGSSWFLMIVNNSPRFVVDPLPPPSPPMLRPSIPAWTSSRAVTCHSDGDWSRNQRDLVAFNPDDRGVISFLHCVRDRLELPKLRQLCALDIPASLLVIDQDVMAVWTVGTTTSLKEDQ